MPDHQQHRILVIGVGSIGERHLRCFLQTGRASVLFVEANPQLRSTIAERYPSAIKCDDPTAALAQGVTAAVIATPASSHVLLATQLARAGAHVMIEKPLSVSLDGVSELKEIIQKRGVVAAVAYVYRAHPAVTQMREAIESGRFGRPLEVVTVSGQHFPTYRPAYAKTYYASHSSGGGAVQDALTHGINAVQWLVGPIGRLVADGAHLKIPDVNVEDTVHVIARHGDVLGSYSLNQHQAPNEMTVTVICERGAARFEYHNCRWRAMEKPGDEWTDHHFGPLERDELFIRQANSFLDAIEGKSPPLCSLEEAEKTLRANLAILASIRNQRWEEIAS
jgi:predicted dehydrogenase